MLEIEVDSLQLWFLIIQYMSTEFWLFLICAVYLFTLFLFLEGMGIIMIMWSPRLLKIAVALFQQNLSWNFKLQCYAIVYNIYFTSPALSIVIQLR